MAKETIFIAGKETPVLLTEIPIDEIEFDATNPRIGLQADMSEKELDQEEIKFFLERKNCMAFDKLKQSIKENNGIMTPVWVIKKDKKYKILEGNSRLLIYHSLRDSEKEGEKYYSKIKAYVIEKNIDEPVVDFIRLTAHLRGTTEWDAYEKSRYLFILNEKGYSTDRLENLTKLRKSDVENSINAYKLMTGQFLPKYGKTPADLHFKFSYFVEYVKDKKLQELMEKNKLGEKNFCSWVGTGKLKKARYVRDLRPILANQRSKELFIKKGYNAAIEQLNVTNPSAIEGIYYDIDRLADDLGDKINPEELVEMKSNKNDERRKLLEKLKIKLNSVMELIE